MDSENTTMIDFRKVADEWEINHQKKVTRDRAVMSRSAFDEKYQGTQQYGPDKPLPFVEPSKLLIDAGYKREIAGADFDLLCRAFTTIQQMSNTGLMLMGGVGCGKTFGITSLVKGKIVRLTDKADFLSLEPEIDPDDRKPAWRHVFGSHDLILDDLGNEPIKSEYGVKIDVVSDFILKWYTQKFEAAGTGRLFATTNLTGAQLVERYGDRVTDRLFSMVCVVQMSGNSKRRKPMVIK